MIKKLLPIALPLIALVGGAMAGDMLRPAPPEGDPPHAEAKPSEDPTAETYFTFPSQFFVPLVRRGTMNDIMVLTLTLRTGAESVEAVEKKEHSLRDALLRQLMIHANTGGFDGNYTVDRNLAQLRDDLLKAARGVTDLPIDAVLIEDIARQQG
ncbi:flagellar basal body-associated FliL family protein [Paracoccus zeaxanthinifaciens]|uniref:flagellar basal body-associated FliL family protein n=1 Tax=Paracoccus zeaxanthinifaciens TaxID=187400 RepID=UPI0003B42DFC|nr:flagellar basal body-associated FliL family protein [Paracoccus zeaxanthinifaciens]